MTKGDTFNFSVTPRKPAYEEKGDICLCHPEEFLDMGEKHCSGNMRDAWTICNPHDKYLIIRINEFVSIFISIFIIVLLNCSASVLFVKHVKGKDVNTRFF